MGKKVLIADDMAVNLDYLEHMLTKYEFKVIRAYDGVEAFEKVKQFLPDVIILDNYMPRMTGKELTQILKSDPDYCNIPIIMFSAFGEEDFEPGVDDYLSKPANYKDVMLRIKLVLKRQEIKEGKK